MATEGGKVNSSGVNVSHSITESNGSAPSDNLNGEVNCQTKRAKMSSTEVVTVVVGTQWGDEGKGKVVDMLAQSAEVVCRCQVRRKSNE